MAYLTNLIENGTIKSGESTDSILKSGLNIILTADAYTKDGVKIGGVPVEVVSYDDKNDTFEFKIKASGEIVSVPTKKIKYLEENNFGLGKNDYYGDNHDKTRKYLIYGGIGIALLAVGIFAFVKLKK